MKRWSQLALVTLLSGCGGDETQPVLPHPAACEEHELALADGSCIRPGVPLDGCAEGFVHDGVYGCEPILPAEPCPPGLMAVPGDETCRAIMECGDGKWGDLPVDGTTEYVDASYAGGDADGSEAKPWPTIGEAVDAAAPGALIAVAAGTYGESVLIDGKPVRLWGICPDQVTVEATGQQVDVCPPTALCIIGGADGTEVGGLALRGPGMGIMLAGGENVLIDRIRVHDNAAHGIGSVGALGPTSIQVRGSLIEQNHDIGLTVMGSQATVEGTVVRTTQPRLADQMIGIGVSIQITCLATSTGMDCDPTARGNATLRGVLIEQNHDQGLLVAGSDAIVEGTVVRNTLPRAADLRNGYGIDVQLACEDTAAGEACDPSTRSTFSMRGSLIEQSHEGGLVVMGSDAIVETTVVRATWPRASTQTMGNGVSFQQSCLRGSTGIIECDPATAATGSLRSSLVEHSHDFGLLVMGSEATVENTVVRATYPRPQSGLYGDGIAVQMETTASTATFTKMLIADSTRAGLSLFGSVVSLADSHIRCAAMALNGELYAGNDFELSDGGNNSCGCPIADGTCKLLSAGLQPPDALPGIE